MAELENSNRVDLGALFFSRGVAASGATEGFRKATYGGVLSHRFNHTHQPPLRVELQALANLGTQPRTPVPAQRAESSKLG